VPEPYAESEPSLYRTPVAQVEGSVESELDELVSDAPAAGLSRNWSVPEPTGERTATQYVPPEMTDALGTRTATHAPPPETGADACVRSVPGLPLASV
jgi:hypothetical protein